LRQILKGISANQAVAKPIPEAHSIWELVLHITGWNETFATRLAGKSQPEPKDGDFPAIDNSDDASWQLALQKLKRSQALLVDAITNQDERNLSKPFADQDYTVSFFLHGILRHIVYHSGQIGLLKKASC
jgi:uncharacterized damage-inducible protein DinB